MSGQTITITILIAGLCFLVYFIVKKVVLPKRIKTDYRSKAKILEAVKSAKAAVEREPQNAEARFFLGKAFLADKREEQALREYRSASRIGISGTNIPETEFRETIAHLYNKFHEPEEALREYILLIKRHPGNPEYYFQAGKIFPGRKRPDLAVQYLRKAVSLKPAEERYHFELGMQYFHDKKSKEAIGELEAALKINPANSDALFYLGKVYKSAKDYTGAIPFLEKASRDQENKLRALVELGGCYMSLKIFDKAIAELDRAVNVITKESDSESLYARYFLATSYEKTKEFAKAVEQWEKIYAQKKSFRDVGEKLIEYNNYRQNSTGKESAAKP